MKKYKVKSCYCEEILEKFLNEMTENFTILQILPMIYNESLTVIIEYND